MTFVPVAATVATADELLSSAQDLINADIERIDRASPISCGPGCGECCVRPVPVTAAEQRALQAHLDTLPADERTAIDDRVTKAAAKLQAAGFAAGSLDDLSGAERVDFARRYFAASVPCPLLTDDGSCGVHPVRPLACREYVVTSDPVHCRDFDSEAVVRIRPRQDTVGGFGAVSTVFEEPARQLLALALTKPAPEPPAVEARSGPAMVQILTSRRLGEPRAPREPTPEERDAQQVVAAFPIDHIIDRYRRDHDLDATVAQRNATELLRFLVLAATAEESRSYPMFGPPDGMDGFWHTFLLFTRAYADLCDQLGGFMHHDPAELEDADSDSEPDDYDEFLERYRVVFGEPAPADVWPRRSTARGTSLV